MPLYPGGVRVGLGLWHSVAATVATEGVLFAAGLWVYLRVTRPRDAVGRWALAGLAAFLVLVYGVNLFGGPPPSVAAISLTGIFGFALLIGWAWWADRHRTIRTGPPYMPSARVSLPKAPPAGGTGPAC
jgi:hypothetical protein